MEKKEPNPCELTWEEKHPKWWIYEKSITIKKLEELLNKEKQCKE